MIVERPWDGRPSLDEGATSSEFKVLCPCGSPLVMAKEENVHGARQECPGCGRVWVVTLWLGVHRIERYWGCPTCGATQGHALTCGLVGNQR